jgi:type II secretory pathway pseudopilin PulG
MEKKRGSSMSQNRIRCRGFLLAELMVATALLGLIITCLAASMNGFSLVNDCQWARQRCTAAAQAQLDSLAATGRLIEPQELKRLWPGVDVTVDRSPGVVPWDALELVQVTAGAQAGPRKVTVCLARYVGRASPLAGTSRARTHDLPSAAAEGGQS